MDELMVQEEHMTQKFIHSNPASLWVSVTRLNGSTTLNTNRIRLGLHIRPLVNLLPLACFPLSSVKYTSEQSFESLVGFK